jgi:predicted AlkP superfamily pyrophosphatase or phosphodiesterase
MRRLLSLAALASVTLPLAACAQTTAEAAPQSAAVRASEERAAEQPPKLVVMIAIDQLSADLFTQYRDHFGGGLARLAKGAVFPSAYQGQAATETCPGHSTLLTGVRPSRNGIVANNWVEAGSTREDKAVYCAEDATDPASTRREPVVSARHLLVPTLGEWLKQADDDSRNVVVSLKDRAAMMLGGNATDAAWWWDGEAFVTHAARPAVPDIDTINAAIARVIAQGDDAVLDRTNPGFCARLARSFTAGPVEFGTNPLAVRPGNEGDWRRSPRSDRATLAVALDQLDAYRLGLRDATDVLGVSLSATDYVGHAYGTNGLEMCLQMAELDAMLGDFFGELDDRGIDYVVAFSSDHGGQDAPERLVEMAEPGAARFDPQLGSSDLELEVKTRAGITFDRRLVYNYASEFVLDPGLAAADRPRTIAALKAILLEHPQIEAVFSEADMQATPAPDGNPQDWSLKQRARASWRKGRSGDVTILLKRGISGVSMPGEGYIATHGSPWDYDRRVPLAFWRKGMEGFEQPVPVETVDIAPTLAAVIGLDVPEGAFDGRCLDLDPGEGNTCGTDGE